MSSAVTMQGPSGAPEFERLAGAELVPGHAFGRAPHLAVARGDVIDDGVAEHVIERARGLDEAARLADDDGQFSFAIDLLRETFVEGDRLFGADHAVGGLDEELRLLAADRRVGLLGVVVAVVAAAAKDGGGTDGRGKLHVLQRRRGSFRRIGQHRLRGAHSRRAGLDEGEHAAEHRGIARCRKRIDHGFAREQSQPLLARLHEGHKLHRLSPVSDGRTVPACPYAGNQPAMRAVPSLPARGGWRATSEPGGEMAQHCANNLPGVGISPPPRFARYPPLAGRDETARVVKAIGLTSG